MVADETALILAMPGDTADTLRAKIGQSGAKHAQLLVPEGVPGLQSRDQLERLRALAERGGVELTLISSDLRTLDAARRCGMLTMQVRDAHVVAPPSPYATQVLDREPARDPLPRHIADDLSAGDAAFLDALDDLDTLATGGSAAVDDEDIFAALDGVPPARGAPSEDDAFADALDSIGADESALRGPSARPAATPAPRPRIRPEDIELSPEEKARATQAGRRSATPPATPRPARERPAAPRERPRYDDDEQPAAPRRQSVLIPLLIILILLVTAAIAALLVLGGGATVTVSAPVRPDQIQMINALPVPLAAPGSSAGTAVEAESIASDVAVSASGQVTESTMAPSGTARGTITILNSNAQPIFLPAGTQFIATKPDAQEVPFVSAGEVTVPPATTSDQGAQIITTRGRVDIEITARSAGSASNIDSNSIRRIETPDGQTFNVDSGALLIQHGPIGGGSEDQVFIVKDSDVRAVLAQGLTRLDAEARQQLQGLAAARGLDLEPTTIAPRQADLQQLQGFEYSVSPAVGETVDPQSPSFTLWVQARYSALATPSGAPIGSQLSVAFTEQLRQAGQLQPGDCKAPEITGWAWDTERLMVDGRIVPNTGDPACGPGLSADALRQVRAAVRGKPIAEARAALDALQQQGVIGGYSLSDVERLPGWDFQLRVEAR